MAMLQRRREASFWAEPARARALQRRGSSQNNRPQKLRLPAFSLRGPLCAGEAFPPQGQGGRAAAALVCLYGAERAGRGIGAAQAPPAGAAGGPRAGVVAVATSARGGCRRGGAATTCRAARGGAALRGRGGGQGRRQTREARSALTGRPPCPPSNTSEGTRVPVTRTALQNFHKGL